MGIPKPLLPAERIPRSEAERMLFLLREARLPEQDVVPGAEWDYGIPLERVRELRRYWLEEWSWEELFDEVESFKHYTVEIEGIDIHYIHAPSSRPDAVPLLMTHGWPGSFYEFHKVIKPLSNPPSEGDIAFNVVVPSLPGYGFSGPPPRKGWTLTDTARVFNTLMVDVLGYKEYVAQGGDWGFVVTRALVGNHSDHCTLAHFNNLVEMPPKLQYPVLALMGVLPKSLGGYVGSFILTPPEQDNLARQMEFRKSGAGYFQLQSTKPATIGYALYDSPLGLLTYVGEKYHAWVDPTHPLTNKDIVNTVALYFLTRTFHTSILPYYENNPTNWFKMAKQKRGKTGMSVFKYDVLGTPRSWASTVLNVTYYKHHEEGGHFAGLEQPENLIGDVREFVTANWKT